MYIRLSEGKIEDYKDKEVILFGAATYGQKIVEEFEEVRAKVLFFCDNNQRLHGKTIRIFDESKEKDYPVMSPVEILKHPKAKVIIASTYFDEIQVQLKEMGIERPVTAYMGTHRDVMDLQEFKNPKLDPDEANAFIKRGIKGKKGFFAGRVGSVELETICQYKYLLDRETHPDLPYQNNVTASICINAGFFPRQDEMIDKFVRMYLEDISRMDLLWSMWSSKFEDRLYKDHCPKGLVTSFEETGFAYERTDPWTTELEDKKVLVIHPFEESIQINHKVLEQIHPNGFMPKFQLKTLRAVQSIAGEETDFATWFDALDYMKEQMEGMDFDVALIGAGAYGLPLAAHAKKMGKIGLHVGGVLQLYFGIKGKFYDKLGIYNSFWTSPLPQEIPKQYLKVESGRYW